MPFVCSWIICETLWVSVNTFYGSTEQTPLVASNGFISSSLRHDVSLPETPTIIPHITTDIIYFQALCSTDQWIPWLILLLRLKMYSHSPKRAAHPCVCPLDMDSVNLEELSYTLNFSPDVFFGAERILRGLSRLRLVQRANKGRLLLPQKGFIITADTGKNIAFNHSWQKSIIIWNTYIWLPVSWTENSDIIFKRTKKKSVWQCKTIKCVCKARQNSTKYFSVQWRLIWSSCQQCNSWLIKMLIKSNQTSSNELNSLRILRKQVTLCLYQNSF